MEQQLLVNSQSTNFGIPRQTTFESLTYTSAFCNHVCSRKILNGLDLHACTKIILPQFIDTVHYVMIIIFSDFRGKYLTCNVDIVHVRLGNLCPDLGYEVQDELNIVSFTLLSVNIPVRTNVSTPLHNIFNPHQLLS